MLSRMRNGDFDSFSCRMHYKVSGGSPVLMDAKMKIVRDSYRGILGVLVIGRDVKGFSRFRERFRLSPREADVISLVVQGNSPKEIARILGLSAETVKTHCTSAYNKLGRVGRPGKNEKIIKYVYIFNEISVNMN